MINYLEGKLAVKDPTYVVVDINGIGYEAKISLITFAAIKNLTETKLLHAPAHQGGCPYPVWVF